MLGTSISVWPAPRGGNGAAPANLVMMFGDSRAVSLTPGSDYDSRDTPRNVAKNPLTWWAALNGRRADIGAAGRAGWRASEYAAYWPVVQAQKPMAVIFHGIVNDINADISSGASVSVADGSFATAYMAILQPLAEEVIGWGGKAIFCTEPLSGGSNQQARIIEAGNYDTLVTAWASAHGQPIIDMKALMRDASSTSTTIMMKTGYCYDTLHLGDYGARKVAELGFAGALNAIFTTPETRDDAVNATSNSQLLTNPWFSTSTGGSTNSGVTGSTPSGWTCELSGAAGTKSGTISSAARGDGKGNDVVLTLTGEAAGQIIRMRSDFTAQAQGALAAAGGANIRIRFICEFDVADADPLASVYCQVQATVNGVFVAAAVSDMEVYSTAINQTTGYGGRMKTRWYTIPAGATLASCQARIFVDSAGAGSISAKFGVMQLEAAPA